MLIWLIYNFILFDQTIDQNMKRRQDLFTKGKENLQLFFVTYLKWFDLFAVACKVPG